MQGAKGLGGNEDKLEPDVAVSIATERNRQRKCF